MIRRVVVSPATKRLDRRGIALRATALVSATAAAAYWTDNYNKTRLEGNIALQSTKDNDGPNNVLLLMPTLEASVRSMRLISTAILMVMDYKQAEIAAKLFPDRNNERMKLEKEKEQRQEKLEKAQIAYTTPTTEDDAARVGMSRAQLMRKLRDDVYLAAEQLAKAEEELALVGDRKGEVHKKAANRLLSLCHANGGAYIKIGQHLANLDYLIPSEYIEVLSSLFDEAPKSSFADVAKVVEEDLGLRPDQLFASFEKDPIASASLAQVHVAYDKTGRKLAVKVQHRGLQETSTGDLFALTKVVEVLDRTFTDFTWAWISDEIAPQLPKELDFSNEGRNAERAAQFIEETGLDCTVPKILWEHSSKRVLCMEFEEGFKATDCESIDKAGLEKRDVARLISSVFNAQVFSSAFIHCDPHPANVLIRAKDGRPHMVLVDHGLYKQIDDDFRIRYAQLWKSLMLADLRGIKESCKSLGVDKMYTLLAAMLTSRPYDEMMERAKTGSLAANVSATNSKSDKAMIQGYAQHFLKDIFVILGSLPRQMLLLLKMNDCLRHIDYKLGSPANTLVVAGKHASAAVFEDRIQKSKSWQDKFAAWFEYLQVLVRIHIHDVGVWWADHTQRLRMITATTT